MRSTLTHSEQLTGLFEWEAFYLQSLGAINAKLNHFTIHLIEIEAKLKEDQSESKNVKFNQKVAVIKNYEVIST